jgi:ornithine carbamoyltransferase
MTDILGGPAIRPPAALRPTRRSIFSIDDLSDTEMFDIVARAVEFGAGAKSRALTGKVTGIYFAKPSTRTRTAFSAGALRLGSGLIAYGPADLQTTTGESDEDTGNVLAGMLDTLVMRTAGDESVMRTFAGSGGMSVINAMSAQEHPTQALCDLSTLLEHFSTLDGLRVLYVGEGNNTATALTLALMRCAGASLELRTPNGYGLSADFHRRALVHANRTGARVHEQHDMDGLPAGIDVIYTTRWQTTGSSKHTADWRRTFDPFRVGTQLMDAHPNAVFMHDLPANRGEEVVGAVLDGPVSLAFRQAQMKMYSAMAVLEWSATGHSCGSS